jgi:hypothetical protein
LLSKAKLRIPTYPDISRHGKTKLVIPDTDLLSGEG